MKFYSDAVECVPSDRPESRGKVCTLTYYVDADHARDQLIRKSVTDTLILMNITPISWTSKCQKKVESSTYGSELVATRITIEKLQALMYVLTMLGCKK